MTRTGAMHTDDAVGARPAMGSRLLAEATGTFMLVFGVVGAALLAAAFDQRRGGLNVGFLGVAFALGLSVVAGASAFANISGAHFNPAVTIGLAVAGRFRWRLAPGYIAAQLIGGLLASSLLAAIAAGGPDGFLADARQSGFASTGWGELSPGRFSLGSAVLVEAAATCVLVWVVLGATERGASAEVAPLVIGLTLTLVALVAIPVSNGSFNPARSAATAVWGGEVAMNQLWMSLVVPIAGAVIAGASFRALFRRRGARAER